MSDKTLVFLASLFILTVGLLIPNGLAGVNQVLSLDGDGDYVEILDHDSLDLTVFTLEVWVKLNRVSGLHEMIAKGEDDLTDNMNYSLGVNFQFFSVDYEEAEFDFNHDVDGTTVVNPNQWYHVAGVRQPEGNVQIFVNGQLENSNSFATTPAFTNSSLYIGSLFEAFGGQFLERFVDGFIDEVRIWNIARTQQEIQATMFTTLTGNETGLVGYWNFDDGTADDLTPNGNNGTLMGDAAIVELSIVTVSIEAIPNPATVGEPLDILVDLSNRGDGFDAKFRLFAVANGNVTTLVSLSPSIPSGFTLTGFSIFSTISVPAGLPPVVGFLAAIFDAGNGALLDWDFVDVGIGVAPSAADINALRHTATDFLNSGAVNAAPGRSGPELNFNGKVNDPFESQVLRMGEQTSHISAKGKLTTTWGRLKAGQ